MMKLYALLALAALILLTPLILYGWGLYRAWRNGKLSRYLWGSVVAAMTLAAIYLILDRRSERRFVENLTGVPFDLRRPVMDYRTGFSFNGDGGSIEAYPIPPEFHSRFNSPPADFFRLPKTRSPESHRSSWRFRTWRRGPIALEDQGAFENSLLYVETSDEFGKMPASVKSQIQSALKRETSYYAYNCAAYEKNPPEILGDHDCYIVDFYILDPVADRLYLIYMKT